MEVVGAVHEDRDPETIRLYAKAHGHPSDRLGVAAECGWRPEVCQGCACV